MLSDERPNLSALIDRANNAEHKAKQGQKGIVIVAPYDFPRYKNLPGRLSGQILFKGCQKTIPTRFARWGYHLPTVQSSDPGVGVISVPGTTLTGCSPGRHHFIVISPLFHGNI